MITKKTKYAFKALVSLALRYEDEKPVLIAELAAKDNTPRKFLEVILLELKNKGILLSKKGKGGGYLLAKNPVNIPLSLILRTLEGSLAPLACLSKTAHAKCDECEDESACGLKMVMRDAYEAQMEKLEKTTLKDLLDCCNRSKTEVMYYI